jgi:hypothetical protein
MFAAFALRCKKPTGMTEAVEFIQILTIEKNPAQARRHIANAGVDHI